MYKILGADQREYGPATADQVRQWIAERRLNGQNLCQAEGTTDWKPLSQVPEFAATLVLAFPGPGAVSGAGYTRTNNMAMAGFILGLLSVVVSCCCGVPFALLGLVFSLVGLSQINRNPQQEKGKGFAIAGLVLSIVGILLTILLAAFGFLSNFGEIRRELNF